MKKLTIFVLIVFILLAITVLFKSLESEMSVEEMSQEIDPSIFSFSAEVTAIEDELFYAQFLDEDRAVFTTSNTQGFRAVNIGDKVTIFTAQNPDHSKQVLAERIEIE
jgi:hypothetical protein